MWTHTVAHGGIRYAPRDASGRGFPATDLITGVKRASLAENFLLHESTEGRTGAALTKVRWYRATIS